MKLTQEQLESFTKNGYLILRSFAKGNQCDAILDIAKAHLKHQIAPIETESEYNNVEDKSQITVRRLRQVYNRDIVFKEWMEDENMRPILKQILGDKPLITLAHHNSIMTKMPHSSTQTSWHQDIRYWRFTNGDLISVWLALDEERDDNGVLEFIPASHTMEFTPDQFDKKEYFRSDYLANQELIDTKQSTVLQKDDVVLFHSKLLHRANKNSTNSPKISFVYTVRASENLPLVGTRSSAYPEIILY